MRLDTELIKREMRKIKAAQKYRDRYASKGRAIAKRKAGKRG